MKAFIDDKGLAMLDDLLSRLDLERNTVIELQRLLVSTRALGPENGGEGERAKADMLKAFLAKLGLPEPTEYNAPDTRVPCGHRPNMTMMIPGQDTSRTFWIMSHMDVVPAGDLSLWTTDPFQLVVDGDELRGRGVEDNHHGLVMGILLAKALHDTNTVPPINLGLLFVADEETGNKLGINYLLAHHPDLFKTDDLFLVPDSGSPDSTQLEVAEKGVIWLKVTVNGKQCHASRPRDGINTLRATAAFITKLDRLTARFSGTDTLFDTPYSTFEPTKKEANVENVNTIPGRDVFYIDCRVLPQYLLQEVLDFIRSLGEEVVETHHVSIDYELLQESQAAPITPVDSSIVKRLKDGIAAEYGVGAKPVGIGGGTVAAYLRRAGYPTVVWGTIYENPHVPNERANITFCLRDAKVLARALLA